MTEATRNLIVLAAILWFHLGITALLLIQIHGELSRILTVLRTISDQLKISSPIR